MLRLIGICLTLAGSFGSGLAFCREKSRHAGTLFLLAELFLRMAEEIGYSAERLPDVFSQMSVWLAKDAENDSFGKEEASALAEALLHCADRLEQERSEPLEVVWNAELGAWAAQTVLSREEAKKLLSFAKEQGFYNVTLNVWADNVKAVGFYEKLGLRVQKIGMEKIL